MRWLLIALVLILQVQMPVAAEAAPAMTSCHEMADEAPASDHGSMDDKADAHRAHLCPGCSIPAGPPLIVLRSAADQGLPVARLSSRLASLAGSPAIPPPRSA